LSAPRHTQDPTIARIIAAASPPTIASGTNPNQRAGDEWVLGGVELEAVDATELVALLIAARQVPIRRRSNCQSGREQRDRNHERDDMSARHGNSVGTATRMRVLAGATVPLTDEDRQPT